VIGFKVCDLIKYPATTEFQMNFIAAEPNHDHELAFD
jgi:hypothetical protein